MLPYRNNFPPPAEELSATPSVVFISLIPNTSESALTAELATAVKLCNSAVMFFTTVTAPERTGCPITASQLFPRLFQITDDIFPARLLLARLVPPLQKEHLHP